MTRNDQLAVAGAATATEDAALETPEEADGDTRARRGLFVGGNKEVSNLPPILEGVLYGRDEDGRVDLGLLGKNATSAFPPLYYIEGLQAASLFYISKAHGLMGANTYFAGTGDAGATAVGRAFRAVRRGEVDVALAGAFDDATSWWNLTKYDTMGWLTARERARRRRLPPVRRRQERRRPRRRRGVPRARGRRPCRRPRRPRLRRDLRSRRGARRLRTADAGPVGPAAGASRSRLPSVTPDTAPADVEYVVAHGCGTRLGDASEARALRSVFGTGSTPPREQHQGRDRPSGRRSRSAERRRRPYSRSTTGSCRRP